MGIGERQRKRRAGRNGEPLAVYRQGVPVRGGRRATFPRSPAVSSPRRGLTSLFGMGRGAPPRHSRRSCLEAALPGGRGTAQARLRTRRTRHRATRRTERPAGARLEGLRGDAPARPRALRAISAARLNVSQRSHLRPINVVVCDGPQRRPHLGAGFALRCLQRLSPPDAATRLRAWRHDRHTVGPSDPVLSY